MSYKNPVRAGEVDNLAMTLDNIDYLRAILQDAQLNFLIGAGASSPFLHCSVPTKNYKLK